jgi:hypothetical protein
MFDAVPWPVYLLFLAAVLLPLGFKLRQQLKADRNLQRAGLAHIHRMAWPEFVRYLETLFSGLGYQVERAAGKTDYGVDLILKDGTGRRTAVNARHFKERVDKPALPEVAEGAAFYDCQDTLLITVVGYTNGAINMAEETGALLWDTEDLADAMEKVRTRPSFQASKPARTAAGRETAAAVVPPPAPAPAVPEAPAGPKGPPCPICGKPMEPKLAAGREIWLCSRFPRCNGAQLK